MTERKVDERERNGITETIRKRMQNKNKRKWCIKTSVSKIKLLKIEERREITKVTINEKNIKRRWNKKYLKS